MQNNNIEILLIEDRVEDAQLAILALSSNPEKKRRIHWIQNGQEAMDFLSGNDDQLRDLKLILLDVNLPKVNGFEILKSIKQSNLKNVPVVMLSTSNHANDLNIAYENHANSYLIKPVSFDSFQELIRKIEHYWLNLNVTVNA